MQELLVLKIGGSVATDKESTAYTIKDTLLPAIFTEIAAVLQKNKELQIILIHGAGGYVHHLAHTYDLSTGTSDNTEKKMRALQTRTAVLQLHQDIVKIGIECSLPFFSIATGGVVTQTNKKISTFNLQSLNAALKQNLIPVLYGDMVQDSVLGMSICSGDAIAAYLSTQLPVQKILFATDVDGIYTDDPHITKEAKLVESMNLSQMSDVTLRGSHNTDTTDGLRGKIAHCVELFNTSTQLTEIHVFNGMQSDNYRKILLGSNFSHSCIKR